ncbi:MAG: decarboxylating 6-phosphogluconate dehydrogenase [Patescibacteria group bacterium]
MKKEIAIVGLGKMGSAMARRMMEKGWKVVGLDRSLETLETMKAEGVVTVSSYSEMAAALTAPRIVWLFLPPQKNLEEERIVDQELFNPDGIVSTLVAEDIVIDGGNSFFKEAAPRAEKLKAKGINFIDAGTSGGPAGARSGACLMIGGERKTFESIEELFKDFALEDGYRFFDGHGAGHFVKMVHNGIEYGMMQTIAEGFELLKKSDYALDLERVTDIYNNGSVIESRLVGWLGNAFKESSQNLDGISSTVQHNGEGEWTIQAAKEAGVDVHTIEHALQFRLESEKNPRFAGKVLSAMRKQFGGHNVKEKPE